VGSLAGLTLRRETNGKFYGTTTQYLVNPFKGGTFFSLDMNLRPFVSFVAGARKVGQTVEILGQDFGVATDVSFNGISARFSVVSHTFIRATVPVGASTGYVTVTTPNGMLKSNVPFQVIQ